MKSNCPLSSIFYGTLRLFSHTSDANNIMRNFMELLKDYRKKKSTHNCFTVSGTPLQFKGRCLSLCPPMAKEFLLSIRNAVLTWAEAWSKTGWRQGQCEYVISSHVPPHAASSLTFWPAISQPSRGRDRATVALISGLYRQLCFFLKIWQIQGFIKSRVQKIANCISKQSCKLSIP